jgi:hypothetical protein
MFRQPKLCLHRRKKSQQSVLEFVLKIRNAWTEPASVWPAMLSIRTAIALVRKISYININNRLSRCGWMSNWRLSLSRFCSLHKFGWILWVQMSRRHVRRRKDVLSSRRGPTDIESAVQVIIFIQILKLINCLVPTECKWF